jgi:hypothetical protein
MFTRERCPVEVKTSEPLPILPTGAGGGAYLASFDGEEQRYARTFPD